MTPTRQAVLDLLAVPRTGEEIAEATGRKVAAILTDIRVLARADRGELRLDLKPVNLPELLIEVGEQMRRLGALEVGA